MRGTGRLAAGSMLGAALISALAGAAVAAPAPSSPARSTGPIEVSGTEAVICSAAFDESVLSVNLAEKSSQSVGVLIECNARFRLAARSRFGVLEHETLYAAGDPLTFVPYTVVWPATLINSLGVTIAPEFTAAGPAWAAGLQVTSAPTRGAQRGVVTIRWGPTPQVIAGTYVDTFALDIVAN